MQMKQIYKIYLRRESNVTLLNMLTKVKRTMDEQSENFNNKKKKYKVPNKNNGTKGHNKY